MRRPLAALLLALAWAAPARAQEVIEYYGTDHLGSIRVVFDAAGTVVSRADYLPFGEEVFAAGPLPAEHFTGQQRDGEAGLDYFHARQYQPRTGRFNAVDPVYAGLFDPQQWNRYAYARNNPLRFVDPSGKNADEAECHVIKDGDGVERLVNCDGALNTEVIAPAISTLAELIEFALTTKNVPTDRTIDWLEVLSTRTGPGVVVNDLKTLLSSDASAMERLLAGIGFVPGGKLVGHHSIAKFLGGDVKQILAKLDAPVHKELHDLLRKGLLDAGMLDASNTSALVWADFFTQNPGRQREAFGILLDVSRQIDTTYGTNVAETMLENLSDGRYRRFP